MFGNMRCDGSVGGNWGVRTMKRVCAGCETYLGGDVNSSVITHGICPSCYVEMSALCVVHKCVDEFGVCIDCEGSGIALGVSPCHHCGKERENAR